MRRMEYRSGDDGAEGGGGRTEETKREDGEKAYFGCGTEAEEADYGGQGQTKTGAVAPKPSDVRNGDLVSLLLAATPPYLYNIPLVPQTFFFSEMLKSFVQAKTERQNLKAHQTHHRRQRKRSWRETSPPDQAPIVGVDRDKPLELTTPKHSEDKPKRDKSPSGKKTQQDAADKKLSDLGSFSVENLANSSIADAAPANAAPSDLLPPPLPPPLWHPLLYPPHPPLGIDPLHFFIDLRVSAHFSTEDFPGNFHHASRHCSAFRAPSPRKDAPPPAGRSGRSRSVHYVISSLREIYRSLEREAREKDKEKEEEGEGKGKKEEEEEEERDVERKEGKKCKDLRALIGLELVVDYVKQESEGEGEGEEEEEEEEEDEDEDEDKREETVADEDYELDTMRTKQQ